MGMNKFGWFMSGCYVMSFLISLFLNKYFVIPVSDYLLLLIGFVITLAFSREEVINGIARHIKQRK
jgi:hypothetical protein